MKELYKLLGLSEFEPISKVVEALKNGRDRSKIFELARKQLDPGLHDVADSSIRKGKFVVVKEENDNGDEVERKTWVEPNRIPIAYQELIVSKAKTFLFGNKPKLESNTEDENELKVLKAVERMLFDSKEKTLNRHVAGQLFSFTEVAEIWYLSEEEEAHTSYGFKTKLKAKVMTVSNKKGNSLYPLFDDNGNLIALSRAFKIKEAGKEVDYFEVLTSSFIYKFKLIKDWALVDNPIINVIGKIQGIFAEQDNTEWYKVQWMIDRLEVLLSDHGEVNDRNAYPTLMFFGQVTGQFEKGPGGAVEMENGADARYLSWDNATDSIKLEIENLIENIHMITQTPNISFKEVKGLGAISGTALKMLFFDAHLKVMEKQEIFDSYLQRRVNLLKAFVGELNPALKEASKNVMIEPIIVPFMIENTKENIENALLENGNKPLKSHSKSVRDYQGNDSEDFEEIIKEEEEAAKRNFYEPTTFE